MKHSCAFVKQSVVLSPPSSRDGRATWAARCSARTAAVCAEKTKRTWTSSWILSLFSLTLPSLKASPGLDQSHIGSRTPGRPRTSSTTGFPSSLSPTPLPRTWAGHLHPTTAWWRSSSVRTWTPASSRGTAPASRADFLSAPRLSMPLGIYSPSFRA